ncbi:hypothetical protein QO014_000346 [Kaistia dalseonensis]|uniref:Uncharacterized protein n=1 Tax=Kaistia dalseonensis TaxID=410840 RepID=A0ABU0H0Z5_9HYPH|nr:hypothetical protein [Kaistia dalseonensis]
MTILVRDLAALAALGLFVATVSLWSDLIVHIV